MAEMASFVMGAASACAVIAAYLVLAQEPKPKRELTRWIGGVNRRLDDLEMALACRMARGACSDQRAVTLPSSPEKRVMLRAVETQLDAGVDLDEVFAQYGKFSRREREDLRAKVLARQAKG